MYDFKLNKRGDLVFSEATVTNKFKLRFCMAQNQMASIRFLTEAGNKPVESSGFKVSFETRKEENGQETAASTSETETLLQYIWLCLATQLGEIEERPELGAGLVDLTYDRPITAAKLNAIETEAQRIVDTVLDGATVTAVRESGKGNMPYQNITIYIRDIKDEIVLTYVI